MGEWGSGEWGVGSGEERVRWTGSPAAVHLALGSGEWGGASALDGFPGSRAPGVGEWGVGGQGATGVGTKGTRELLTLDS
ncbi:hypothetical protein [Tolypothrix sp. VBCCA 56010]|uniref:hypothetical protein n=1 Tax=Tolypothrix sp. VBCCA 56010 TaxID=3137731 RepID=UPI003D7C5D94